MYNTTRGNEQVHSIMFLSLGATGSLEPAPLGPGGRMAASILCGRRLLCGGVFPTRRWGMLDRLGDGCVLSEGGVSCSLIADLQKTLRARTSKPVNQSPRSWAAAPSPRRTFLSCPTTRGFDSKTHRFLYERGKKKTRFLTNVLFFSR